MEPAPLVLVEELAWLKLLEERGHYDGAWWDDFPNGLVGSLPRGVLFPPKFHLWDTETYETAAEDLGRPREAASLATGATEDRSGGWGPDLNSEIAGGAKGKAGGKKGEHVRAELR